ncbi:MAG TPA: hypothetical protein PLR88_06895 [Bacteroidales bacterium]|nr:hypothetical protein [Bacteroidales bacterium]
MDRCKHWRTTEKIPERRYPFERKPVKVPKDFIGFEALGSIKGEFIIELDSLRLIYFD